MKKNITIFLVLYIFFIAVLLQDTLFALINENSPFAELKYHQAEIGNINYSPDGNYIAATSADGNISLWDTKNFKLLKSITASDSSISFAKFSLSMLMLL